MTHFTQINRILSTFFLLIFSLSSVVSFASVNIRTGSFSHVTTDIEGVERNYNNTFTQKGVFGEKWKTVYDNRLQIDKEENILSVYDAIEDKYHKFTLDSNNVWQGASGTMIEANNNYTWEHKDSRFIFNEKGLIIEYHLDEYESYTLKYNSDGHIRYFLTSDNVEYYVDTNNLGNIVRFTSMNVDSFDSVEYDYLNGMLVSVIEKNNDENPAVTKYIYNNSNLTFINDGNNYIAEISYKTYDGEFRVNKYKNHSSVMHYEYRLISNNLYEKNYSVTTYKERSSNKIKKMYVYVDAYENGNFTYTKNLKKYINNKLVYDGKYINKCKPTSIVKNGNETTYAYDESGHVLSKETKYGIVNYQYNTVGKVTYVNRKVKGSSGSEFWARYNYNQKNDLISASNSDGLSVNLEYDSEENIVVMSTKDKTLYISYNKYKKPITIMVNGMGALKITYDEHGEISSVDAGDTGHKAALAITQAFQVLLTIVSDASKNSM